MFNIGFLDWLFDPENFYAQVDVRLRKEYIKDKRIRAKKVAFFDLFTRG